MFRISGIIYAALAALFIALVPLPSAQAAPVLMGSGNSIRETVPQTTDLVRRGGFRGGGRAFRGGFRGGGRAFRVGRSYRGGYYRPVRAYRPYRPYSGYRRAYRPAFYGAPVYGPRCVVRRAQLVWTSFGYQLQPARRVCRY